MKLRFAVIFLILPLLFGCDGDNVTEPPDPTPIRITSPSNNSTLEDPVTVIATAGSGYTFTRVDFYIDGDSVWSDTTSPYQYYWNIFVYSGISEHTILAVGHTPDTTYTSATVTVEVVLTPGFSYVSTYEPNSQIAYGVTSYSIVMFVSTGDPGLEVIDISSKSSPQYLSRYDSFGRAMKADISSPFVYIADMDEGALKVDFSDVSSLILTGIYNTPGLAKDVAVSENYLYVADQDGIAIADISSPDTLIFVNRQELPPAVNYVVVRGDTAFVTNVEGFYVIDFTNPYFPDILGGAPYITQGQAQGVAVTDTFAFIADDFEGVIALSIADPSSPRFLARYAVEQGVSTVDTGDSTLFIGTLAEGVFALDYSQPDTLRLIDQFVTQDIVWQVHSAPPYLYAATSRGVNILRFVR